MKLFKKFLGSHKIEGEPTWDQGKCNKEPCGNVCHNQEQSTFLTMNSVYLVPWRWRFGSKKFQQTHMTFVLILKEIIN